MFFLPALVLQRIANCYLFFFGQIRFKTSLRVPQLSMVLASPPVHASEPAEPFHSMLKDGEEERCRAVKRECMILLECLNNMRGQHTSTGVDSLRMVQLYNATMMHLDCACDGIVRIMSQ